MIGGQWEADSFEFGALFRWLEQGNLVKEYCLLPGKRFSVQQLIGQYSSA
jgi:hypothetical protein